MTELVWLIALGCVAIIPAVAVALARRQSLSLDPWSCPSCGYSFVGLGERGQCPECGRNYDRSGTTASRPGTVATRRLVAAVIPLSGFACLMPFAMVGAGLDLAALVLSFNAIPFGLVGAPIVVLASRTSCRGVAALTLGGTLGAVGLLIPVYWAALPLQDPLGALVFVFGPVMACGSAGIGLGIGFLIERTLRARPKA